MKSGKFLNLFYGIFLSVGIIMLISSVMVLISDRKFVSEADEISGVIETIETYRNSNGDTNHRVYVGYTYNGKEYSNVRVSFYNSSMYEGKNIILYCDPQNPGRVVVKGTGMFAFIMMLMMGIIFTCVGIIPISVSVHRKTKKKKIQSAGRYIYATVDEIGYNTSFTVNRRHPYIVYCSYRDDYRDILYRFKSENLWVNPEPVLTVGSMIRVYVEEGNYKNYYVDVESMIQGKIVDYT